MFVVEELQIYFMGLVYTHWVRLPQNNCGGFSCLAALLVPMIIEPRPDFLTICL
jgi:hypothetical protein